MTEITEGPTKTRSLADFAAALTVADLPELASGRYHFARKFDLKAGREVLDRIDRELLGVDPEDCPWRI